MGSLISRAAKEEAETPEKDNSVLKIIEDPRSPTEEISRTPIEVSEKQPKESTRHLAFANALREQNKTVYESSPIYPRPDKCDVRRLKNQFSTNLDNISVVPTDDFNSQFNISAIEKENK